MKRKILALITALAVISGSSALANEWSNDDSTIRATVEYKDVDKGFWGYEAISNATRYGWFSGYADGTFKPHEIIKRSEAAKAISNLLKLDAVEPIFSTYSDIDTKSWYSPYVEATKNMFYPSYGNEFKPSMSMSREDALYLLVKAYGYDTLTESVDVSILDSFSDNAHINSKMRNHIAVGIHYGLLAGFSDGTLKPGAVLTRAQFATLLDRLYSMGKNNVPTNAMLERIEISNGQNISVSVDGRVEITAEAVYSDGKRMNFTNNLNIYTEDKAVLQVVKNRIYGLKKGTGKIMFNNPNLAEQSIVVTVQ